MTSHLLAASTTAPSSPTITSNAGSNAGKQSPNGRHDGGFLPPPAAPLVHALKSLHDLDPHTGPLDRPHVPAYDSPYSRSIPSTAPGSPRIPPLRQNSGSHTPRIRPHATTLNIPGMTRSRVSPDGRIPDRDVAAKLVIIMVGLPARGKSYITKKIQRYLSWQQHNTRIFNVGNRRRIAAGVTPNGHSPSPTSAPAVDAPTRAATILLNGTKNAPDIVIEDEPTRLDLNGHAVRSPGGEKIDQSAKFFDPNNESAAKLREQVALDTLDELLDYLLHHGGSVGILDATNSTIHRRELLVTHIKQREPKLGILFIESICHDQNLLEANMRLKLSGPDYKDKDPVKSLADFKQRVKAYESAYQPLGKYEEDHDLQYIQMIDVGRKVVHHRLKGFLSSGIASYLTTFNLSPRQIWITRHGQSVDNQLHKLGGDSELTERGHYYGLALYSFITQKRQDWLIDQKNKVAQSSFPPLPGDHTPPYPELNQELDDKNFCVWTSMLKRSIETAEYFDADDDYDVKAWEMLNELNAGTFEGMTYDEIAQKYPEEYLKRSKDKLQYIYPGVGGEGYLQVISRLRDMVREIERITDHVLIISHRSVCRVLMAYFMDLTREDIADLDVPLGMLYAIEPKPYGIEFHAYKYNEDVAWFEELPNYKPQRTVDRNN
ncbi:6-phosphofructo-2-kinase-domain-containing protein [Apodospora peruviana]|uniref:6-phosphofructo-2-kinase-domain-containing protein n=1 Tax=Apodospora peruviana TaxID=516989 RepID=A0AAE0HYN7_9PEZI|nr:6-phosphofructo-2-kinase-domain-containing protein [Apodospora peruviana]